uniref:Uncharacterized protein n=1 Tax=Euplotes crassus TaxID=5936 RepID=A0A7S3KLQ2_EUPCR|mmetsp:Transcript_34233/g.33826  ORF Transcript_34233/g.33826 Transcript_34233/m.33826 type:complete len:290 (+) Transcript_34233:217-1086(+)
MEKTRPTETYVPKINEKSKAMEQRRQQNQQKVPRHEILLEMGRIYTQERELRQAAHQEGYEELEDLELEDGEAAQFLELENQQQKELKDAIQEIKKGNYNDEEAKYIPDYENANNSGSLEKLEEVSPSQEDHHQEITGMDKIGVIQEDAHEDSNEKMYASPEVEKNEDEGEDGGEQPQSSHELSPSGTKPSEPESEDGPEGEDKSNSTNTQIPLLFVDVNLGEGTTDRIVLYEGDDPSDVAKEFSTRHSLDTSMTGKLTDLLTQQMNGVLTKIVEVSDMAEGDEENDEE